MKLFLRLILFSIIIVSVLSCSCINEDCPPPYDSIYMDMVDENTNESMIFGNNSSITTTSLSLSTTSSEGSTFPKVATTRQGIYQDSLVIFYLEGFSDSRLFVAVNDVTTDTIDVVTSILPESDCCESTIMIDSVSINEGDMMAYKPPLIL